MNVTENIIPVLGNEKQDPAMNYRLNVNPLQNNGTRRSGLQEEVGARDSIPIGINRSGFRDGRSGRTKQLLQRARRKSRSWSAAGGDVCSGNVLTELP